MNTYGFQRLTLLGGSGGYDLAELPLDDAVSLVAPNNIGKTSLINALQFLLIIDKRQMDFGAHTVEGSRRFYFPHNSAYVLLEAVLPDVGSVVLGAVGRGVSHDYTYFVYKGQLDINDFRLADGAIVPEPRLNAHFETLGRVIRRYDSTEFAGVVYGGRRRRTGHGEFTVFRLEDPDLAPVYQRVLTRTLRLDKLKSEEVKAYLLEIFRHNQADPNIDFKAEWDKGFAEINANRAQYTAALHQLKPIEKLEAQLECQRVLRGKIRHFRPLIDAALQGWQQYYESEHIRLRDAIIDAKEQSSSLSQRQRRSVQECVQAEQRGKQLEQLDQACAELANRFALVPDLAALEAQFEVARAAYEAQVYRVRQADSASPDHVRRQIQTTQRALGSARQQRETLHNNLYLALSRTVDPRALDCLNRVLHQDTLALSADAFSLSPDLRIDIGDNETIDLGGMRIDTRGLTPQFSQKTPAELEEEVAELTQQLSQLEGQLATALELQQARALQRQLERDMREAEIAITEYQRYLTLAAQQEDRDAERATLAARISELQALIDGVEQERQRCSTAERAHERALDTLDTQHQKIEALRRERLDHDALFDDLNDLPPSRIRLWQGVPSFELSQLADMLGSYHRDCRELRDSQDTLERGLRLIRAQGLTKFENDGDWEKEIDNIIAFAAVLPKEAEALARAERAAIVNIAYSLRSLRNGLDGFKSRMQGFNRIISGRQVSDLKTFMIRAREHEDLVKALELLDSTAEQANAGDTFELFNHSSLIDDREIAAAKDLLIREGEARGGLRVENLFMLEFVVAKHGQPEESFTDIDSAASNGTVLMAKLVTGLALLYQMQDKRHPVRGVCYLDEAAALDPRNQRNLIDTARDFGFALIFASPAPQTTVRYIVPISSRETGKHISAQSWQILEPLPTEPVA